MLGFNQPIAMRGRLNREAIAGILTIVSQNRPTFCWEPKDMPNLRLFLSYWQGDLMVRRYLRQSDFSYKNGGSETFSTKDRHSLLRAFRFVTR